MSGDPNQFSCPACGKVYRWTAQVAGKKSVCSCGQALRVPILAGQPAEAIGPAPQPKAPAPAPTPVPVPTPAATTDDTYELDLDDDQFEDDPFAPQPEAPAATQSLTHCPSCNSKLNPGAVICMNCGYDLRAGRALQTSVSEASTDADAGESNAPSIPPALAAMGARSGVDNEALAEDRYARNVREEVIYPSIIAGVSLLALILNSVLLAPMALQANSFFNPTPDEIIGYAIYTAIYAVVRFIIQAPAMLLGLFLVARMFGSSYGSLITGLLKLVAVLLAAGATSDVANSVLDIATGGFGGFFIPLLLSIVVFDLLCMWLFDMDHIEAAVLWFITVFGPTFLALAVLAMFAL